MTEPAYMRLRKHIPDFAQQHHNKSVRIMPELQMCKEFGVSRVTVRNALEPLINMGILVVKRGIGTFTNPEILEMPGKNNLVIGIIVGGGQPIHFDLFSGSILSGIFFEGPRSGARITLVHLEDDDILSKARML